MENTRQIYVNVDDEGNIIAAQTGEYIIPSEEWDHFFLRDEQTESTVYDHKVVIIGTKAQLVLKDVV